MTIRATGSPFFVKWGLRSQLKFIFLVILPPLLWLGLIWMKVNLYTYNMTQGKMMEMHLKKKIPYLLMLFKIHFQLTFHWLILCCALRHFFNIFLVFKHFLQVGCLTRFSVSYHSMQLTWNFQNKFALKNVNLYKNCVFHLCYNILCFQSSENNKGHPVYVYISLFESLNSAVLSIYIYIFHFLNLWNWRRKYEWY